MAVCLYLLQHVSHVSSSGASPTVAMLDLQRLVYICCACLRLFRIYINEVYPNSGQFKNP